MKRFLLLAALITPTHGLAQELTHTWSGRATLYGWLSAAEADTSIALPGGGSIDSSVSAGLDDILDALDFAAFGTVEARRDRLILLGDVVYTKLSTDGSGPAGATVKTGMKTFFGLGAVGWRAWSDERTFVDAFGGARLVYTDVDLSRSGAVTSQSGSNSETFVDPVIGARVGFSATDRLNLMASANIGGFNVGSDFSWEAFAGANYAFTERFGGEIGFRYLSIDYENDGNELDLQLYGPVIGVTVQF